MLAPQFFEARDHAQVSNHFSLFALLLLKKEPVPVFVRKVEHVGVLNGPDRCEAHAHSHFSKVLSAWDQGSVQGKLAKVRTSLKLCKDNFNWLTFSVCWNWYLLVADLGCLIVSPLPLHIVDLERLLIRVCFATPPARVRFLTSRAWANVLVEDKRLVLRYFALN